MQGNNVNPQCNIFYRHDYTQLDIFENAKKSHAYAYLARKILNGVRTEHKRKGNAKKCVCKHTQNQILITQV